jgi:DNA-binding MarR family transcriptional regulator
VFFLKELPSRQMIGGYTVGHPQADPEVVLATLQMMRQASLLIRRLESFFAEHDLSQLRFLALIVIDREPERDSLTASEIADRLDVSRPVTTRTLQSLTMAGLVRAEADEQDGRSRCIALTEQGRGKLAEVLPGYFAILIDASTQAASAGCGDRL